MFGSMQSKFGKSNVQISRYHQIIMLRLAWFDTFSICILSFFRISSMFRWTKAKEYHFVFLVFYVNVMINPLKMRPVLNKLLIFIVNRKRSRQMRIIKQMMMTKCINSSINRFFFSWIFFCSMSNNKHCKMMFSFLQLQYSRKESKRIII